MLNSQKITKIFWNSLVRRTKESEHTFIILGIFWPVAYIGWYLLWLDVTPEVYENLPLRIIASCLAFLLLIKNYWPKKIKPLMPIYWYLTLLYLIPFFFTFMLLKNNASYAWQLNGITAFVLFILISDWLSVTVLTAIGVPIGVFAYILTTKNPQVPPHIIGVIANYSMILLYCAFFLYKRSKIQDEKLASTRTLASSVAHELRTPLLTIHNSSDAKQFLPDLIKTYEIAKKANLDIPLIRPSQLEFVNSAMDQISKETYYANSIINLLLTNIKAPQVTQENFKIYNITECVNNALKHYPFQTPEEQKLIKWDKANDFRFKGDCNMVMHILFNLLKNATYYVTKAKKGNINIWLERKDKANTLHFKDTGQGIVKKDLPYIFELFFSKTLNGTGIGLAFCQSAMQNMDGNIICNSRYGKFAEFVLSFPKIGT